MDIYAERGHKVRCVNLNQSAANWGANTNPDGVLEVGKTYTVEKTEVHSYHTKVYLEGVVGKFNSVHFEDA